MRSKQTKPAPATGALVFQASLAPDLYRALEIADKSTLYDLAHAVVAAFDFDFDHAFGFYSKLQGNIYDSPVAYELFTDIGESDGRKARGVKRTLAADAFPKPGHKMKFLFDYGDGWEFVVEFKHRKPKEPRVKLPRVLLSAGQAPAQYPRPDDEDED